MTRLCWWSAAGILSIKELKELLTALGIDHDGCLEKVGFVNLDFKQIFCWVFVWTLRNSSESGRLARAAS